MQWNNDESAQRLIGILVFKLIIISFPLLKLSQAFISSEIG